MKTISVFIRIKNEAENLRRTLQAIRNQTHQPDEIVVLDNHSTDASAEVARQNHARVDTIRDDQFSYGRALNRALEVTSGDLIVFLSAHSPPADTHWLKNLALHFENGNNVSATFGRQIPEPGINPLEEWLTYLTFPARPSRFQKVKFSNANAAVLREVLKQFQFREDLAFAEDIEWAKRVQSAGGQILYCPAAVLYHSHPCGPGDVERRMFNVGRGMKQCGSGKNLQNPVILILIIAGVLTLDIFYCLFRGYWTEIEKIPAYRREFFRGLLNGLKKG